MRQIRGFSWGRNIGIHVYISVWHLYLLSLHLYIKIMLPVRISKYTEITWLCLSEITLLSAQISLLPQLTLHIHHASSPDALRGRWWPGRRKSNIGGWTVPDTRPVQPGSFQWMSTCKTDKQTGTENPDSASNKSDIHGESASSQWEIWRAVWRHNLYHTLGEFWKDSNT